MTTAVDICNSALAMIGEAPKVTALSPAAGGPHATLCAALYPAARETVMEMHAWTFASKRAELAKVVLSSPTADAGTNRITVAEAHGIPANGQVTFVLGDGSGWALPAPLEEGVVYYVRSPATLTFQLAEEEDGDAIDLTTAGTGTWSVYKESDRASWAYAYAAPSDLLKAHSIVARTAANERFPNAAPPVTWPYERQRWQSPKPQPIEYELATNIADELVIYTSQEDADLVYTAAVTDVALMTPLCRKLIAAELATQLAGAIAKDDKIIARCERRFAVWFQQAVASDASQRAVVMPDFTPWNRG